MGTHYLVDLYDNPVATAKINDVNVPLDGRTPCNGNFVVRVPPGVAVRNPTDLADLKAKKHAGLLVWYAGFSTLDYDDLLDPLHVDMTDLAVQGKFGDRASIAIDPGARLTSTIVALAGLPPSQAVVTWECFEYETSNDKVTRFSRTYHELDSDAVSTCQVSFDGGSDFISVTEGDGGVVTVPVPIMGTNFIIRIVNVSSAPICLGSWAVIY